MGVLQEVALGTLRLTLGRGTTESDIEIAAQTIGRALKRIQT
jgi:cysteine sulfinate desulfinase/cysteine desulfurase-like protein